MLWVLQSSTSVEGMRESVWSDFHGCSVHLERNRSKFFGVSPSLPSKEIAEVVAYFRIIVFLLICYNILARID